MSFWGGVGAYGSNALSSWLSDASGGGEWANDLFNKGAKAVGLGESLGSKGIGSHLAGSLFKSGPQGIPDPSASRQSGKSQRAYMNSAYPGTNPWEQLGSSQSNTPIQVNRSNNQNQRQIARTGQDTSRDVAKISARASIINNAVTNNPQALPAALRANAGGDGSSLKSFRGSIANQTKDSETRAGQLKVNQALAALKTEIDSYNASTQRTKALGVPILDVLRNYLSFSFAGPSAKTKDTKVDDHFNLIIEKARAALKSGDLSSLKK